VSRVRPAGFSLMELVIAISIMAILAGTLAPVVSDRLASTRDARRLTDVKTLVTAVEGYLMDVGKLPDHDAESGYGGWDTTVDGKCLSELLKANYLREPPRDPKNDVRYHYRYYHYPAGYEGFASDFYVIGVRTFETEAYRKQRGHWQGTQRDWTREFAYVTGGLSR
jgi:general secretion pathway protein G